ncbi:hypothetical protein [Faecalibaculum rodentium]|uniref:hypothetical protein n=1 Tax=Faecalibaculum rodentium TaxID=1702221 RepID=UPI00136865BD|nr:hypothetical protein [Faecalibaculum rodentium]
MAEIKSLLDEVIEAEIAYVGSLSPEDEKKSKAIQHLADLHKLRIDEIKAKTDADEKRLRRAMDSKQHRAELTLKERQADGDEAARANEEQFKQHQLNDQVLDRYVKIGVATAELVLPLVFYGVWMKRGLKFEETGTFTSQTFKNLFNRFKPTRKS